MRTEAFLLIGRNCFEMWWPGTELNRRRQPFQGCALPPELPGHFLSAHLLNGQFGRALGAITGRDAAKQNSRCAGTVRNSRIITTPCPSLKMVADNFCSASCRSRSLSLGDMTARHAIHNRQSAAICAKPVRDLAIVTHVKHGQVGVFTRFHAAFAAG